MAESNDQITVMGSETEIRSLIRKAIREGVAMTLYEEECIEEEFLRLARRRMRRPIKIAS